MAMLFFTLWTSWQLIYPYKPLVLQDEYFPINKGQFFQGEIIQYLVRYCKKMSVPAEINYQFENSVIFFSTRVDVSNAKTGCGEHWRIFEVPVELPPGRYRLVQITKYKISMFREIVVTGATEEFDIIEK